MTLHRRFRPAVLGGEGGFWFQTYALARRSAADIAGRDTARASVRLDWRRNWILPLGVNISALGALTGDFYLIRQDSSFAGTVARATPIAAVELRWPWIRTGRNGVSQVIEPVVQLIYSPADGPSVPNEDSTLVEFDEMTTTQLESTIDIVLKNIIRRTGGGLCWELRLACGAGIYAQLTFGRQPTPTRWTRR